MSEHTLYIVQRAKDGLCYTHGYPGSWGRFPRAQFYQSKSAAAREANRRGAVVVPVAVAVRVTREVIE